MANYSKELTTAIEDVDAHFPGKTSSAPIMKFISAAESNYGQYDPESALSYGPFQIDPVRYYDIAQDPKRLKGEHLKRINRANEFLRGKLNNPDFNISNLATYNPETKGYDDVNLDMMRNPYVGATLTRMGLMQDPGDLPEEEGLSEYYQNFWGPKWSQSEDEEFKAGKRAEAQDRYDRINESTMMDNVTNEQGSEAF